MKQEKDFPPLAEIVSQLRNEPPIKDAVRQLRLGKNVALDGVWGASSAAILAGLCAEMLDKCSVVLCATEELADQFIENLKLFYVGEITRFPWYVFQEWDPDVALGDHQMEMLAQRLRVLHLMTRRKETHSYTGVYVTSIQACMETCPGCDIMGRVARRISTGEHISPESLCAWLGENGYHLSTAVVLPGEYAMHGGILDIFALEWNEPVRMEFFGDEVESLRTFHVDTQRSLTHLPEISLSSISELLSPVHHIENAGAFPDYLTENSWIFMLEPDDIFSESKKYLNGVERRSEIHNFNSIMRKMVSFPLLTAGSLLSDVQENRFHFQIESVERFFSLGTAEHSRDVKPKEKTHVTESVPQITEKNSPPILNPEDSENPEDDAYISFNPAHICSELDQYGADQQIYLVCAAEGEISRLQDIFSVTRAMQEKRLHFRLGTLSEGFRLVNAGILVLSSGAVFRRNDLHRPVKKHLTRVMDSFTDLQEGDLVVHIGHGIGIYRGLKLLEPAQTSSVSQKTENLIPAEEHLVIEFQDHALLFVPVTKIGLIQKYISGIKTHPKLAKLGGKAWGKNTAAVKESINDLAVEMLEIQAQRHLRPGISFPGNTDWQREFAASFPYRETPDQVNAIRLIEEDMSASRPMDRLLCGDVGFGKTEVAMRAAFSAVEAGYQTAIIVPTTILAQQHWRTFKARMAEFPIQIATLSRFSSKKQQALTLKLLREGKIDIIIGTHRLAQSDVQFHNLGLLIIDEEQRFGVQIKEYLKSRRSVVDVLTMTATPIPRTLHMSLMGIRDIANLETPPDDRMAVETHVSRYDEALIKNAIQREIQRRGQIFFVHNRVRDIYSVAQRLHLLVPEARICVGHAQMEAGELERVMVDFVNHKYDILVSTTIVESGLDIPNANTMFINQADRYGLADLHQLRGRVGRYKNRAYCYMLVDRNVHLNPAATKRLRVIEEYSHLGAGFHIAMRDLEIRGAGNILGTTQSGHIALVGYEYYCDLLDQAIRKLKKIPPREMVNVEINLPVEAFIPHAYIPELRVKMNIYRRLARVVKLSDISELREELSDRFGTPPPVVMRLLKLAELRILAHQWFINGIRKEGDFLVFHYASIRKISQLSLKKVGSPPVQLRVADNLTAYLPFNEEVKNSSLNQDKMLELIEMILR